MTYFKPMHIMSSILSFSSTVQSELSSEQTKVTRASGAVKENVKVFKVENMPLFQFLQIIRNRISETNFSALDPIPPNGIDISQIKLSVTTGPFVNLYEIQYLLTNIGPLKVAFNGCTLPLLEELYNCGYLTICPNEMIEAVTLGFIKWCPISKLHDFAIYLFQPSVKLPPFNRTPGLKHLVLAFKQQLLQEQIDKETGYHVLSIFQTRIIDNLLLRLTGSYKKVGKVSPWSLYQNIKSQQIPLSEAGHRLISKALCDQNVEYCLQHFKEHRDTLLSDLNASSTILLALVYANKLGTLEEVCSELVARYGESPIFYSTLTCAFLKVGKYNDAFSILARYQGSFSEEQSEPICYQLARLCVFSERSNSMKIDIKTNETISSSQLQAFLPFFINMESGAPVALGSNFPFLLSIVFCLDCNKAEGLLYWLKKQPLETKMNIKYSQLLMSLPLLLDTPYIPYNSKGEYLRILLKIFPEASENAIQTLSTSTFVNNIITPKSKMLYHFFRIAERECDTDWDSGCGLSNSIYFSIIQGYLHSDYFLLNRVIQYFLDNVYLLEEPPSLVNDINDFDTENFHPKKSSSHIINSSIITPFHVHACLSDIVLQSCIKSYNFDLLLKAIKVFKDLRLPFNKHYFAIAEILENIKAHQEPTPKQNYGIISNELSLYELSNSICPEILLISDPSESIILYDLLEKELNITTAGDIRVLFETDSDRIPQSLDLFKEAMAKLSILLTLPEELENSPSFSILLEPVKLNPPPLRFLLPLRT